MRREWLRPAAVLVVALVGLAVFREYTLRKEDEVRTENGYQRAFQEVVYHLDGLETELGKALASGSTAQMSKAFADAWRHAESARAGIGQLPLAGISVSATEDFLGQVAAFTYSISQKGASGKTLTDREWGILQDLRRRAEFAANELAKMGQGFSSGAIRWTDFQRDVAAAAATGPEPAGGSTQSSQVTKSFKMLEDGMTRFPSPDLEGILPPPRKKLPAIAGPTVGTAEALRIASTFLGAGVVAGRSPRVMARVPSEPEAYRIEVPQSSRGRGNRILLDVSVRGGRVLWMMDESPIGPVTVTPATAEEIARRFLASRGFGIMRPVSRQAYQGVAVVGFVSEQDGVLVYPDHVVVRVALDDGGVRGFEGTNYQVFHRARPLPAPSVSEAAARTALNPRLDITFARLAIIMDDFYKEKLVYEFRGEIDGETYAVYVNADTGEEEEVKKVTPEGVEVV